MGESIAPLPTIVIEATEEATSNALCIAADMTERSGSQGWGCRSSASPRGVHRRRTFLVAALLFGGCAATYERELTVYPNSSLFSDAVKQQYSGKRVHGKYRVGLNAEKRVQTFDTVQSIRDADEGVHQIFASSRFDLGVKTVMLEIDLNFVPWPSANESPDYRPVAPGLLSGQLIERKPLQLPLAALAANPGKTVFGFYMIFVERDGSVSRVDVKQSIEGGDDALIDALKAWRFKPQPARLRTMVQLACAVPPTGTKAAPGCMLH